MNSKPKDDKQAQYDKEIKTIIFAIVFIVVCVLAGVYGDFNKTGYFLLLALLLVDPWLAVIFLLSAFI